MTCFDTCMHCGLPFDTTDEEGWSTHSDNIDREPCSNLIPLLEELDPTMLIADNAQTWTVECLVDALRDAAHVDRPPRGQYAIDEARGIVTIVRVDADGFFVHPPIYVGVRDAAPDAVEEAQP